MLTLYEPCKFLDCFRSALPPHIIEIKPNDFEGCLCPGCAPDLWNRLAAHPTKTQFRIQNAFPPLHKDKFERYTAAQLYDLVVPRLNQMDPENLSETDSNLLSSLNSSLEAMEQCLNDPNRKELPSLGPIALLTNELFFGGLLGSPDVEWQHSTWYNTMGKTSLGNTRGAKRIRLNPHPYTEEYDEIPLDPVNMILFIILHEQIHVLFGGLLCSGHCDGTPEQKALCDFLQTKMLHRYDKYKYGDEVVSCEGNEYGHGPFFYAVAMRIQTLAHKMRKTNQPIEVLLDYWFIQEKRCLCRHTSSCMFGCEINRLFQNDGVAQAIMLWRLKEIDKAKLEAKLEAKLDPDSYTLQKRSLKKFEGILKIWKKAFMSRDGSV